MLAGYGKGRPDYSEKRHAFIHLFNKYFVKYLLYVVYCVKYGESIVNKTEKFPASMELYVLRR